MYHLNESMYPKNDSCYECLCTEHFDNSTSIHENSDCERERCWPQIYRFSYLRHGCAPVFHTDHCCAVEYKCRRFR